MSASTEQHARRRFGRADLDIFGADGGVEAHSGSVLSGERRLPQLLEEGRQIRSPGCTAGTKGERSSVGCRKGRNVGGSLLGRPVAA